MKRMAGKGGFSLIEILVAGALIALSVLTVVAFVRKGQEMIALQKHRAMARGIILQRLEQPPYQPEYYNNLTTIASPVPTEVTLDTSTNPDIVGKLTISISDSTAQITSGISDNDAMHRVITATIKWVEYGRNDSESVSSTKWLADVQRD
jgi:type II secretory pathway pseudopilin PulG